MTKFLAAAAVISTIALAGSPASAQMNEEAARASLVPFYKALNAANAQDAPELIKQSTTPGWVTCRGNDLCNTRDETFASAVAPLAKRYRLIVPDLRGAGMSQRPASGYEKKALATDVKELMDHLKIDRAHVIGHDIGARVAYAFAVQYSERLLSLTVAEAFIEGLAGTAEFKRFAQNNPRTQHFARFARVDEAVGEHQGKEEELILSFMNSRSKSRKFIGDDVTRYTASLKRDGGLRAAFMSYEAFDRDATFAADADTSKLAKIPALAIVCQNPVGNLLQRQLVAAGLKNVKGVILDGCAHWIYEENINETLSAIIDFLGAPKDLP